MIRPLLTEKVLLWFSAHGVIGGKIPCVLVPQAGNCQHLCSDDGGDDDDHGDGDDHNNDGDGNNGDAEPVPTTSRNHLPCVETVPVVDIRKYRLNRVELV